MPPPRLPVVLDAGPAVHQRAGLSRYTERLAAELLAHHRARVDLRLFYNAHSGHTLPPALSHAPTRTLPLGQYAWRLSVLASQLARIPYAPLLGPGCVHGGAVYHASEHLLPNLPGPAVLTVHDLIFERYPAHHTRANRLFLRVGMPLFVRAAQQIIAVSRQTQRDLVEIYRADPAKITVIYNGVDPAFQPAGDGAQDTVRARYSPDRPYLLMVGTLEPRKNHLLALRALARLKAAGHPHRLLIAGGRGWLFDPLPQIAALGLANDVLFTGYVDDADLPALYSAAACVLMPSLYEGFGLPMLEAMACAAPVISSTASSLPEIGGDAALYTSPHDDEAFAAAIHLVLTQPALADALRARGLARAQEFTWARCAQQTVEVYHAAAGQAATRLG
jgi:glycosyltransferase involved in cell wall biosynthesis